MTKINLREQYPDFYKTDYIIEVPDEVAAVMKELLQFACTCIF